ncbi:hypothetical protein ANCCEY_04991 [Ancylostoma ceylanicum]|uniref:Uncharacterized protein n=1 Tax=Ancylostoma ceylanicum TaxID=53326 RepID=A0A0D6LV52_9BILA|nr:hypothetical protein ANCCEY_04991 [Ancylostoma ceylanicum]
MDVSKEQVNDIVFHPQHNTLVTIGSDGRYSMWDKDARTKLKTSDAAPLPLTCAAIHASGQVMAYAIGYDWSRQLAKGVVGSPEGISGRQLSICSELSEFFLERLGW